MIKDYKL